MTAAERIERILALEILRGERPVGSRLPGVRALASLHDVTPPTIQRVIARLEAKNLVQARHGQGVTVLDPALAGLALLPLQFEAHRHDPARCQQVLADFLELRRVFAVHLLQTRALAPDPALAARLFTADTLEQRIQVDLDFTRSVLAQGGNVAAMAVFDTVRRLVTEVPFVADAIYGDADRHRQVLMAIAADPEQMAETLEAWDAESVATYGRMISA